MLLGILRKILAGLGKDDPLVGVYERLEGRNREFDVGRNAGLILRSVQCRLEALAVQAEHRLAEHLDESAVRVPGEVLVAGLRRQSADALVVEPDVEDGVHHPRHREFPA